METRRRRRALIPITLHRKLADTSPVHHLASLPLFDLTCGDEDIICDFDFKHVIKQFRNILLRQKGVTIDGVTLSASTVKAHLVDGDP